MELLKTIVYYVDAIHTARDLMARGSDIRLIVSAESLQAEYANAIEWDSTPEQLQHGLKRTYDIFINGTMTRTNLPSPQSDSSEPRTRRYEFIYDRSTWVWQLDSSGPQRGYHYTRSDGGPINTIFIEIEVRRPNYANKRILSPVQEGSYLSMMCG